MHGNLFILAKTKYQETLQEIDCKLSFYDLALWTSEKTEEVQRAKTNPVRRAGKEDLVKRWRRI